jgi:hypothetical protein
VSGEGRASRIQSKNKGMQPELGSDQTRETWCFLDNGPDTCGKKNVTAYRAIETLAVSCFPLPQLGLVPNVHYWLGRGSEFDIRSWNEERLSESLPMAVSGRNGGAYDVLTLLHSGEPKVEALLDGLEALKLGA